MEVFITPLSSFLTITQGIPLKTKISRDAMHRVSTKKLDSRVLILDFLEFLFIS